MHIHIPNAHKTLYTIIINLSIHRENKSDSFNCLIIYITVSLFFVLVFFFLIYISYDDGDDGEMMIIVNFIKDELKVYEYIWTWHMCAYDRVCYDDVFGKI